MEMGMRIASVRNKLNLNQTDFANILGLTTPGAVSHWEKGLRKPDIDTLLLIAEKGDVKFDWLVFGKEINDSKELVNKSYKEKEQEHQYKKTKRVLHKAGLQTFRIVSDLSAGKPLEFFEDHNLGSDDIVLPYPHKNCLVLQVKGDSMTDKICNGDLVLVDLTIIPKNGDIVAVRLINGEQLIKRQKQFEGLVVLYSENEEYQPIMIKKSEIAEMRKVVKVIKDL
jgi:repressor LexA